MHGNDCEIIKSLLNFKSTTELAAQVRSVCSLAYLI